MCELGLSRFGREQPDPGALLLSALGEDELTAAVELEPEGRRLGRGAAGGDVAESAGRHQVYEEDELAVVGREKEALAPALGSAEAAAFERRERRVERLERRDVRRTGLRHGKSRDGLVELAPPRLHLGQLGHRGERYRRLRRLLPWPSRS